MLEKTYEGVRRKGPFSCLGLQVGSKRADQITINFSLFWLMKYYLNIILNSYFVLITKRSPKKQ